MIKQNTLDQFTKIAYPGIIIHYSELKDVKDKTTISDKGEISKALSSNNMKDIAQIVLAIYKNTKYKGTIVDDKGKIKLAYEGKVYDISIKNSGSVLKIVDGLNKKETVIGYKANPKQEIKKSMQDQIMEQLNKRKMTDKEVMSYIKELEKGI